MHNYQGDNDIGILNTKYYYRKLDEGWDDCEIYAFYNKAKNILDRNKELHVVSYKILKALCYVYKKSVRDGFYRDICNFLYFWLGDILLEKLITKDLFQKIILEIFDILINDNENNVCRAPHLYMHMDDFKDIKKIFDCSQDYNSYITHLISPGISCSNNYKTYLEKNVNIYNKLYTECEVEQKEYQYCNAFTKYFPNNKKNLFSKFNCSVKLNDPASEKLEESHDTELGQSQKRESNGGLQEVEKLLVRHTSAVESLSLPHGSSVAQSEINDFQIDSNSLPSDDTSSTIISKSVTGAVSVAGALVPSYLLYNYTPAGIWINKLLGRTTRMNHNPLMEAQLMNNLYQPDGLNSERSGYNISYRPV